MNKRQKEILLKKYKELKELEIKLYEVELKSISKDDEFVLLSFPEENDSLNYDIKVNKRLLKENSLTSSSANKEKLE